VKGAEKLLFCFDSGNLLPHGTYFYGFLFVLKITRMEQNEMTVKATQMFETQDGKIVDVLYATSDGNLHYTPDDAAHESLKLVNRGITLFYRDASIRRLAENRPLLQRIIFTADYLKTQMVLRKHGTIPDMPTYQKYLEKASYTKMEPLNEELFKFLSVKVAPSSRPVVVGAMGDIYMNDMGIVKATFIRRLKQRGIIWQRGDDIILTTLFHTELMRSSYSEMFEKVLGNI